MKPQVITSKKKDFTWSTEPDRRKINSVGYRYWNKTLLFFVKLCCEENKMAAELTKMKRKRTALRNVVTKTIMLKCEILFTDIVDDDTKQELSATLNALRYKEKVLKDLDSMILEILEPEDMEEDLTITTEFEIKLTKFIDRVKKYLDVVPEDFYFDYSHLEHSKGSEISNSTY